MTKILRIPKRAKRGIGMLLRADVRQWLETSPKRKRRWRVELPVKGESTAAFPILVLLARQPLTSGELAKALTTRRETIRDRCRQLEGQGYIVQRAKDYKWVLMYRVHLPADPEAQDAVVAPHDPATVVDPEPKEPKPLNSPERVAQHYRVPLDLDGIPVSIGKRGSCLRCAAQTYIRYGADVVVCQNCARLAGRRKGFKAQLLKYAKEDQ